MSLPLPPGQALVLDSTLGNEQSGELERDEYSFILDTTLKKKHRSEATVLAFIDSFVKCKNLRQASNEAGIDMSVGYSYKNRSDISHAIQKLTEQSVIKYGFDASEVIERTKEIVDFDPIMLQNNDGTYKSNLADIDPEARRAIKKFEATNMWATTEDINGVKSKIIIGELIKVEFYDKLKAIELVGKEKDLFKNTTKHEHDISSDMKSFLLESQQRGQQAILDMSKRVIEVQGTIVEDNDDE